MLQRAAAWLGLPAGLQEAGGELPSKRPVGDGDDQGVLRGELFQPGCGVVDASRLGGRGVLPTEEQEQGSSTDGQGPRSEGETEPCERGAFEVELAEQGRDDDLVPGCQQARRGNGTGCVAGEHEVGTSRQLLERGRNALVFADPCGFIGLTPRSEAAGVDPAGVDVRRAGVTNQGDATTLCLNGALHAPEDTSDAERPRVALGDCLTRDGRDEFTLGLGIGLTATEVQGRVARSQLPFEGFILSRDLGMVS